jgi:hypothetical protein
MLQVGEAGRDLLPNGGQPSGYFVRGAGDCRDAPGPPGREASGLGSKVPDHVHLGSKWNLVITGTNDLAGIRCAIAAIDTRYRRNAPVSAEGNNCLRATFSVPSTRLYRVTVVIAPTSPSWFSPAQRAPTTSTTDPAPKWRYESRAAGREDSPRMPFSVDGPAWRANVTRDRHASRPVKAGQFAPYVPHRAHARRTAREGDEQLTATEQSI